MPRRKNSGGRIQARRGPRHHITGKGAERLTRPLRLPPELMRKVKKEH